ncbi:hypothetical protein [Xenorhabdus szentirmaii]|uniref:Uncharacterized protein n=1 Tax=Xenorhabdus szentirmaii DSM 16338 TaxID=1427518 RepID=W1J324_9GAMM|nr:MULTISPECIES: hypothetical protein [Xenorhabdus]MBD2780600.1 hypothetical protein [Xenorhabdus sp. 38]PHM32923.1 hypothetical protein Xsze_03675 [Xenorhabdus szentirmaii DSM 16338]CDL85124.1 hypothetical protein XSR1_600007 [Xenorhabdus szentirmaii DSM 16338]
MYDYIDDLWCLISEGLLLIHQGKEFKCYFLDQPIEIKFIPSKGGRVTISINCHVEFQTSVDKKEFLISMSEYAEKFSEKIEELNPKATGIYKAVMKNLSAMSL